MTFVFLPFIFFSCFQFSNIVLSIRSFSAVWFLIVFEYSKADCSGIVLVCLKD